MRKRRRLANKMTIMVCAVLIAVCAFFYAPMEVDAFESDGSISSLNLYPTTLFGISYSNTPIGAGFKSGVLYSVELNPNITFTTDNRIFLRDCFIDFTSASDEFYFGSFSDNYTFSNGFYTYSLDNNFKFVMDGSLLKSSAGAIRGRVLVRDSSVDTLNYNFTYNPILVSAVPLTGEESASYQQGYNTGYSAGEEVGESNGYSSGYSDGFEAGEQNGYDTGFQAGSDSVDTQSYYDMGYSAGYDAGYASGYDTGYDDGYDAGWSAYEAQMDKWGADTSDYPFLKYSFFEDELRLICDVFTSAPSTSYDSALLCYLDFDINPNHTYKFAVKTGGTTGGTYDALYSDYKLNFVIGSNVINATNNVGKTFDFFIPGYNMGSSILFEAFVYDCVYYGGVSEEDGFLKHMGQVYPTLTNCYIDVYDMGPSGDTQNHIANQTDQLTNGYDDSKGNTVNSELSTGLNEYETAENSLFATATTGMKDFTFFDFESVPAMITGMSFIGSIMGSWFNQAGGASGVGIVLSILFSVILVAMVLGLYRWYQSRGGKN